MKIENLKLQKQIDDLIDKIYPIGSYYETSVESFNPNVEWGGTWKMDSKGFTTVGAYTNGEQWDDSSDNVYIKQGEKLGETEHQLTINEMPSHNHPPMGDWGKVSNWGQESSWGIVLQHLDDMGIASTESVGSDNSHNNVQPSIGVFRWHRTA